MLISLMGLFAICALAISIKRACQRTTCPYCFKFVSRKATICAFCHSNLG